MTLGFLTGDKTGLLTVANDKQLFLGTSDIRTHIEAHLQTSAGATVSLPTNTYVESNLDNNGIMEGVEHLYSRVTTRLHAEGRAICTASKGNDGSYLMTTVTIMPGGILRLMSSKMVVTDGLQLYSQSFQLQGNGKLEVTGAATISGEFLNIAKSSTVVGNELGYAKAAGPGKGETCQGGSGAGHGGSGGYGSSSCSSSKCDGGAVYDTAALPLTAGSGGGTCANGVGAAGGAAIRFVHTVSIVEGNLNVNGESSLGGGGGSGGSVWLDSHYIRGWGFVSSKGGTASSDCHGRHCCRHYGGGGGGGRIRVFGKYHPDKVLLHNLDVSAGTGGNSGHGEKGTIETHHQQVCSGKGDWSADQCICNDGYVGYDCQYGCSDHDTCSNNGQCDMNGKCKCHEGYSGYFCERECSRNLTCSTHGTCTACGSCVCDRCFHGDGCSKECSGFGQCSNGQCECDACHIGLFCESTCNGHGTCGEKGCDCEDNWRGKKCTIPGCPGEDEDCSGHGICNSGTGVCYCHTGFTSRCNYYYFIHYSTK